MTHGLHVSINCSVSLTRVSPAWGVWTWLQGSAVKPAHLDSVANRWRVWAWPSRKRTSRYVIDGFPNALKLKNGKVKLQRSQKLISLHLHMNKQVKPCSICDGPSGTSKHSCFICRRSVMMSTSVKVQITEAALPIPSVWTLWWELTSTRFSSVG